MIRQYYIIIRDDLNHGEEVNRSDFFDNSEDAIQWGKDQCDIQHWYWVLEEVKRFKCEKCGKDLSSYPFNKSPLCMKCHLETHFQSLGTFSEVHEPW